MRNSVFFCIAVFFLSLSSCSWDNDTAFYPITAEQFLLLGDKNPQLLHVQQGELNSNWLSDLGWEADINDMDASAQAIWFVSEEKQQLLKWDVQTRSPQTFVLTGFSPAALVLGRDFILLIDSLNHQLGFWDPKSEHMLQKHDWHHQIGHTLHINGKYFVQSSSRNLQVWEEKSLQKAADIPLSQAVFDLQKTAAAELFVLTKDSTLYQQTFSYYSYAQVSASRPFPYDKVSLTPYLRTQYGKEWLRPVWLRDSALYSPNFNFLIREKVGSYAVDFFEGQLLFQKKDSLFSFDLHQSKATYLGAWGAPIQKYRALRLARGE